MTFFWAYLAGALTLINPCVLPLLPIIIASSFQSGRRGPLVLALGLTLSFTAVGVLVTAFGHLIGLDDRVLNRIAAILMIAFGIVLLLPKAQEFLSRASSPLAGGANDRLDRMQNTGLAGQLLVGILLGAVWSPCIGPTLGGAIGLAASGENLGKATFTMVMFGIGVSTVLLALAYGSQGVLANRQAFLRKIMPYAKPIMGVTLLVVGLAIWFKLDKMIETFLLDIMPVWLQDLSVVV